MVDGAVSTPGVCGYCDCCEESPCSSCRLHHGDAAFYDAARTVCRADACVRRYVQECKDASERAAAAKREFVGLVRERFAKSDAVKKEKRARLFKRVSRRRRAA